MITQGNFLKKILVTHFKSNILFNVTSVNHTSINSEIANFLSGIVCLWRGFRYIEIRFTFSGLRNKARFNKTLYCVFRLT